MSTPIAELRRLLTTAEPTKGVIVAVAGRTAQVATPQGLVTAQISADASLTRGDSVRVERGIAYPRTAPTARYRL